MIDLDEFRIFMASAGVPGPTRDALLWLARRVSERHEQSVVALTDLATRRRGSMED